MLSFLARIIEITSLFVLFFFFFFGLFVSALAPIQSLLQPAARDGIKA